MFEPVHFVILLFAGLLAGGPAELGAAEADCAGITSQDTCLESGICDVFETTRGEVCQLACDHRASQSSCESDGQCQWSSGVCGYRQSVPGC